MEPPSPGITVINQSGRRVRTSQLRQAASLALKRHGLSGELSVLLTDDEHVRQLNKQFRGVDEPTDILTFPTNQADGSYLGDIAISVPYAVRQAGARGVSLSQELGYLAIHGALHIAGLDDESDQDRENMVAEMNQVAVAAGLKPDEQWWSMLHGEDR
jgi:probable rRNA maturation factor